MDVGTSPVEAKVDLLDRRLAAVEQRLERLESRQSLVVSPGTGGHVGAIRPGAADVAVGSAVPDLGTVVGLIGRTLFVLAGAFLLRALTDSGSLDARLGVVLGLAFAGTWILMTDRAGRRGQRESAGFHGLAFILIAFPLLFEATSRFHFLTALTGAIGLGAGTALALAVAWRRHLHGLAWVATVGAIVTAIGLVVTTGELGPVTLFLVLLGVAALWLGYALQWTLLRWPVAVVADLLVLLLSIRAVAPGSADTPAVAIAAEICLLGAYLGSFAARTLVLNRDIIPFEVAQSIAAILAGLGGAAYLSHTIGGGLALGVTTLGLAAGCYAAAAIFIERRQRRRRNYYFYTSAALVLALAGVALAFPASAVSLTYALIGVGAAASGRLGGRMTYRSHAATYLTAAVIAGGLVEYVLYGLGLPAPPNGRPSMAMLDVLVLAGAALWGLGFNSTLTTPLPRHYVPRLIVVILFLGGVLGILEVWMFPPLAGPERSAPAIVATVRTALLVAAILGLAFAFRTWAFVEGAWLVYPLLVLTGLKFVIEDVSVGHSSTLFVGFALCGLALIAAPRLCRNSGQADRPVSRR